MTDGVDYKVLAYDLTDPYELRDELPATRLFFEHVLNGAGMFEFAVPVTHDKVVRDTIDPGRTAIYILRQDIPVFSGILWDLRMQSIDKRLVCSGEGFLSYFGRRLVTSKRTYDDVDQHTIIKDLINYAQGNGSLTYGASVGDPMGDIGIVTSGVTTSGIERDVTYEAFELKPILEAIQQMSDNINGFDFSIELNPDLDRVLNLYYPRKGINSEITLTGGVGPFTGKNIRDYQYNESATTHANKIWGVGAGEGIDMLRVSSQDTTDLTSFPLLEDVITRKDVKLAATLTNWATAELQRRVNNLIIPDLSIHVDPVDLPLGAFTTGDSVRVVINEGFIDIDSLYRIMSYSVRFNGDDLDEEIKVVVSPEEATAP